MIRLKSLGFRTGTSLYTEDHDTVCAPEPWGFGTLVGKRLGSTGLPVVVYISSKGKVKYHKDTLLDLSW